MIVAALVLAGVAGLTQLRSVRRQLQDTFSKAYYGLDARMLGRRELEFPARRWGVGRVGGGGCGSRVRRRGGVGSRVE